ncbi:MAG: hypothetical protein RIF41_07575 [Polyangiaceae bacterium]
MSDKRPLTWDECLEAEALSEVARVQDSGEHDGMCPTFAVPAHIPVQRLSGLARRNALICRESRWALTLPGLRDLEELRARYIAAGGEREVPAWRPVRDQGGENDA